MDLTGRQVGHSDEARSRLPCTSRDGTNINKASCMAHTAHRRGAHTARGDTSTRMAESKVDTCCLRTGASRDSDGCSKDFFRSAPHSSCGRGSGCRRDPARSHRTGRHRGDRRPTRQRKASGKGRPRHLGGMQPSQSDGAIYGTSRKFSSPKLRSPHRMVSHVRTTERMGGHKASACHTDRRISEWRHRQNKRQL